MNERHIARTYRSLFIRANEWSVGAAGGSISSGVITLAVGEYVGCLFVPPYDLDPSFPIKFRVHFIAAGTATNAFLLKTNLSNNDGTAEAFNTDPSSTTALTTPIPNTSTTAPMASKACVSGAGSLTLTNTTRRNWAAGLYLTGATASNAPTITGVEIAYVPMIAGVFHDVAPSAAAWAS